jgi:acetyl esterase/lipase
MRSLLTLLSTAAFVLAAPAGYFGARLADHAEGGAVLVRVFPDTPAARAGLRDGDVVVKFGDAAIGSAADLGSQIRARGAGTEVEVAIVRDGERQVVKLTLGVHPRVLLEQPDTSPGMKPVEIERDLSYVVGDAEAHERHKLNLFVPKGEEKFPIVLWIHAGAWSYGDRAGDTALAMRFAERGVGFAPMSYRLSSRVWNEPGAPTEGFKHPAHAEDCAMAFAWLRRRFPGHPLFLSGHSCGAHLSALLAMDPRYLGKHGLELDEIRGVIAIGGGYDLVKYHDILANGIGGQGGLGKEKADAHFRWIFGETKEQWIAASPVTYLEGSKVPMLIVAEKEPSMKRYTRDFEEAVDEAGIDTIRFLYMEDRTHGQSTPFMSRKAPDPVRDAAIAFIRERAR